MKRTASRTAVRPRLRRALLACAGLALPILSGAAPPAPAPTAPRAPTREELRRPTEPERVPPVRLTVEGGIERTPCALAGEAYRDIRFTPRTVAFDHLRGLDAEALRAAYEPFLGQEQPIASICEIRDRAAAILHDAGYIAAVEIPEQRIADGALRFDVLMAKLVAVRVRGDAGRSERTIAHILDHLTGEEVFNRFQAERYLLLASDLPGYRVRLSLHSAGGAPGEVVGDVIVQHAAGALEANVQNLGSHALGPWGGALRGELYGLTGLGDRTSVAVYSSLDLREQQTLQLGHEMRLGSEGLTVSGQFTYAWARPDIGNPALDVRARTLLATGELRYPLVRRQAASLWAAAGLDLVDQRVAVNGLALTRDRLRVAFARLDFDRSDETSFGRRPGYNASEPRWRVGGSLELRKGVGLFGASRGCGPAFLRCLAPGAVGLSHFEGDPRAALIRFQGQAEFRPTPRLAFLLGTRAQYADKPLLAFEEYSAGNYAIGRGYDPAAVIGDRGAGIQAEIRYGSLVAAGSKSLRVQPFAFFDAAWVRNEDKVFTVAGRQRLASAGGGLRAAFGDRARLEVTLAAPLDRAGLQTRRPGPRLLVTLTTRLLPWSVR